MDLQVSQGNVANERWTLLHTRSSRSDDVHDTHHGDAEDEEDEILTAQMQLWSLHHFKSALTVLLIKHCVSAVCISSKLAISLWVTPRSNGVSSVFIALHPLSTLVMQQTIMRHNVTLSDIQAVYSLSDTNQQAVSTVLSVSEELRVNDLHLWVPHCVAAAARLFLVHSSIDRSRDMEEEVHVVLLVPSIPATAILFELRTSSDLSTAKMRLLRQFELLTKHAVVAVSFDSVGGLLSVMMLPEKLLHTVSDIEPAKDISAHCVLAEFSIL